MKKFCITMLPLVIPMAAVWHLHHSVEDMILYVLVLILCTLVALAMMFENFVEHYHTDVVNRTYQPPHDPSGGVL